jgi:hypothetical protein
MRFLPSSLPFLLELILNGFLLSFITPRTAFATSAWIVGGGGIPLPMTLRAAPPMFNSMRSTRVIEIHLMMIEEGSLSFDEAFLNAL